MNAGSLLNIARLGMAASQAQIAASAQNVTNAQTPGYSRQRVTLTQGVPLHLPQGTFGSGVLVQGVDRMRNELMDAGYRRDTTAAAFTEERRDALSTVENVLGEPSNSGLASSFEQLWSAFSDLSTNPTSTAARGVVRQRASQVAAQLNQFGNQIADAQVVSRTRLLESADRVNTLAAQVADINARIVEAESDGNQSPDMRDQRDTKIDELASLIGATAYPQADGSVNVNIGGDSLVDGANFKLVRIQATLSDPTKLGVALGGSAVGSAPVETIYQLGGQMAGTIDAYNTIYPSSLASLDGIAAALVTATNVAHGAGFIGSTAAGNFYDPSRTTARTIALDASILSNVANIASSGISGESGDNSVAVAMSRLRDTPVSVNGQTASISEGYRTVVASIATSVNASQGTATAARTLATQSDTRRESVKGVSVDEEMVSMMKYQQAYSAAARLVSVVDEMTSTLINLGR